MITAAEKINIGGLVGGRYLLIPITLAYNGLAIKKKDVLFNTGAGVYALIEIKAARNFCEVTGAKRIQLRRLCALKGYNGGSPQMITYATIGYLTVDSRRGRDVPFLEVPGLAHEMLIGRIWLAE